MNIACVTTYDATDRLSFGGRTYYMTKSLEREVNAFEYVGPLKQFKPYSAWFRGLEYYYNSLRKKDYTRHRDPFLLRYFSRLISRQLNQSDIDIIFSPTNRFSQPIAYLETDIPIVTWTDATFASFLDYHPEFTREIMSAKMIKDGLANERNMFMRTRLNILKTDWAKKNAVEYYGIDPGKLLVVPGGPSLEYDILQEDVERWIANRSTKKCRLVFMGGNWEFKGGPIAYEVVKRLNKNGLQTELLVIGCQPKIDSRDDHIVTVLGTIEKFSKNGFERFSKIMRDSHFFIMPTKAEAMGISYIEANAFGLPAIGTNTGGVSTVIRDDVNGMLFDSDADIDDYCEFIADNFLDNSKYQKLAKSSYNEYKTRLNWNVSAKKVVNAMQQLLNGDTIIEHDNLKLENN